MNPMIIIRFDHHLPCRHQEQEAKLAAAAAEEQARVEEAERRLAEQGEEATRRRRRAAHADAVAGFNTLLAEMVRDPEAVWEECRDRLKKDAQVGGSDGWGLCGVFNTCRVIS